MKRLGLNAISTAFLNIILNLVFVGLFGYQWAEYTTMVSYDLMIFIFYIIDHKVLNEIISYPTSENIALFLKEQLEKKLNDSNLGVSLYSLRIWEGKDKWVMVES